MSTWERLKEALGFEKFLREELPQLVVDVQQQQIPVSELDALLEPPKLKCYAVPVRDMNKIFYVACLDPNPRYIQRLIEIWVHSSFNWLGVRDICSTDIHQVHTESPYFIDVDSDERPENILDVLDRTEYPGVIYDIPMV